MRRPFYLLVVAFLLIGCGSTASQSVAGASEPVAAHELPTLPPATAASPTVVPPALSTNQASTATTPVGVAQSQTPPTASTVFIIMMENHNWHDIKGNPSAPYINNTLLPLASHAEHYSNPPGIHPSEPNYLWLEAGTNFGITDDADPARNHQATPNHLVSLLDHAGISWKSYQEDIDGTRCPVVSRGLYAAKHNAMVYFDDVTSGNNPNSASCISHIRPYPELSSDLQQGSVAHYTFITPNLCNDMHDSQGCQTTDSIKNGDSWLAQAVPAILRSQAYEQGGILFITWDEGEGSDGPIGLLALSPKAKGNGYANSIVYTHSSLLRSVQEIFGVTPLLGDAENATDLRDLFQTWP